MGRFYFDINDGQKRTFDDTGQSLPDVAAARETAIRELALIIRDELPDGDRETYVVTVRDETGAPVYLASASLVFESLVRP